MSEYVKVATVDEVPPGAGKLVRAKDEEIALFNVEGKFFATQPNCLHRQGPLAEGTLDGEIVTCPWHGWRYNVRSGEHAMNPSITLKTYPTRVDGTNVLVEI
jgi:nitrite reductase (NADH) small subunit/3-phenylpropionate/trans-cinnamate dioxygenase ferredoxin subunit